MSNNVEKLTPRECSILMKAIGWDKNEVLSLVSNEGWAPETLFQAYAQGGIRKLSDIKKLDTWSLRYLKEGHLWGDKPSETATLLINNLHPQQKILEIGYGYGRDLLSLLKNRHNIKGIETSTVGHFEATRIIGEYIKNDKANLETGNIITSPLQQNFFDAVMAHRVLHLTPEDDIEPFVNRVAGTLKPTGYAVFSARNPDDFDAEQMEWIDEKNKTAKYKNRDSHIINFWDKEKFTKYFSPKFNIVSFHKGKEIESINNTDNAGHHKMTNFTVFVGTKKTSQELTANGHHPVMNPEYEDLPSMVA